MQSLKVMTMLGILVDSKKWGWTAQMERDTVRIRETEGRKRGKESWRKIIMMSVSKPHGMMLCTEQGSGFFSSYKESDQSRVINMIKKQQKRQVLYHHICLTLPKEGISAIIQLKDQPHSTILAVHTVVVLWGFIARYQILMPLIATMFDYNVLHVLSQDSTLEGKCMILTLNRMWHSQTP